MNTRKIVLCVAFVAITTAFPVVYATSQDLPTQYSKKPSVFNNENMQSRGYSRRHMLILKEKPEARREDLQTGT